MDLIGNVTASKKSTTATAQNATSKTSTTTTAITSKTQYASSSILTNFLFLNTQMSSIVTNFLYKQSRPAFSFSPEGAIAWFRRGNQLCWSVSFLVRKSLSNLNQMLGNGAKNLMLLKSNPRQRRQKLVERDA